MKELLLCGFCDNLYNLKSRLPRILKKCGHSICSSCLKIFIKNRIVFVCSKDKIEIETHDLKIQNFPFNQELIKILENPVFLRDSPDNLKNSNDLESSNEKEVLKFSISETDEKSSHSKTDESHEEFKISKIKENFCFDHERRK